MVRDIIWNAAENTSSSTIPEGQSKPKSVFLAEPANIEYGFLL